GQLGGELEPRRELDAAGFAGRLGLLPPRAGEIAAHDAFDIVSLRPPDQHRLPLEERSVLREGLREGSHVGREVMARGQVAELLEPEAGNLRENTPLA